VCVSNLQFDAVNEECDHPEQRCGTGGDTGRHQIGHHVHQFLVIVVFAQRRVIAISPYETVPLVGAFACFTGFDLCAHPGFLPRGCIPQGQYWAEGTPQICGALVGRVHLYSLVEKQIYSVLKIFALETLVSNVQQFKNVRGPNSKKLARSPVKCYKIGLRENKDC